MQRVRILEFVLECAAPPHSNMLLNDLVHSIGPPKVDLICTYLFFNHVALIHLYTNIVLSG